MKIATRFLILALITLTANGAETGDLKIRFEYGGDPPKPLPVNVTQDSAFCGKHGLTNERLLVHPENKGIQNVLVYVYTGRGGSKLPAMTLNKETHTLANKDCRFEPRIVIAKVGDTLKVTNPDPVGHNANVGLWEKPVNLTIPPGGEEFIPLEVKEPAPAPVACNIHPWMSAHVVVLEHPYAAKSDRSGELTIKGLPAGEELVFRAFHEAGSIKEVKIDGKDVEWKLSRFEVKIKPGMNDLGTVVIPADSLRAD